MTLKTFSTADYHSLPHGATNSLFTTMNWSQDPRQQLHVSMCHNICLSVCLSAPCLEHICSIAQAVNMMVHKCAMRYFKKKQPAYCSQHRELCKSCSISLTRDRMIKQRCGIVVFLFRSNFMYMNTTVHTLKLTVTLSLRPKDKAESQGKTLGEGINH